MFLLTMLDDAHKNAQIILVVSNYMPGIQTFALGQQVTPFAKDY